MVAGISALGGWRLVVGKTPEKPVKVMLFIVYFWLLAFAQLLLSGLAYTIWQHY
jgi:hypothetical protein